MEFNTYQQQASFTDQYQNPDQTLEIGFQNLFEVSDSLRLRGFKYLDPDKKLLKLDYKDKIIESLGDCLWYISAISKRLGVELDDVAQVNLKKLGERWEKKTSSYELFDESYSSHEQLPRTLTVEIKEVPTGDSVKVMVTTVEKYHRQVGARVNDNWHTDDGYRFHDVFHLSHAAYLGWSPVLRALMDKKRKFDSKIDEVEDGARAINLEEAVTSLIYQYAKRQNYFEGIETLDNALFVQIDSITKGLEVESRTYDHWQEAILEGYKVFRKVRQNKGGVVSIDMLKRRISFRKEV